MPIKGVSGIHAYKRCQEPFYLVTWKRYLTPLPGMDAADAFPASIHEPLSPNEINIHLSEIVEPLNVGNATIWAERRGN